MVQAIANSAKTETRQAPLSMEFSRQEYWSGLPFPSAADLPHPGIQPISPVSSALQADSLPTEPSEKPSCYIGCHANIQSVQFSSVAQSCPTLCDPKNHSTPGLPVHPNSQSSLRLTSIESVMPSSHLILCLPFSSCPLSLPASGSFPMNQHSHEVAKVLEFQL